MTSEDKNKAAIGMLETIIQNIKNNGKKVGKTNLGLTEIELEDIPDKIQAVINVLK